MKSANASKPRSGCTRASNPIITTAIITFIKPKTKSEAQIVCNIDCIIINISILSFYNRNTSKVKIHGVLPKECHLGEYLDIGVAKSYPIETILKFIFTQNM